jgi:hypothetical protein
VLWSRPVYGYLVAVRKPYLPGNSESGRRIRNAGGLSTLVTVVAAPRKAIVAAGSAGIRPRAAFGAGFCRDGRAAIRRVLAGSRLNGGGRHGKKYQE